MTFLGHMFILIISSPANDFFPKGTIRSKPNYRDYRDMFIGVCCGIWNQIELNTDHFHSEGRQFDEV